MYEHLRDLIRYGHRADTALAELLLDDPVEDDAAKLFEHELVAQDVWIRRVLRVPVTGSLWPEPESASWPERINSNRERLLFILDDYRGRLDSIMSYSASSGAPFETRLHDIITHVTIHGQHHRAQIARVLRERGIAPPALDYIYFIRQSRE